jgi:Holliday junction DNA helicase RuvB
MEEFLLTIPPSNKGVKLADADDEDFDDRPMTVPLKPFTLVGATTRVGLLSDPLRDRFGQSFHMNYYSLNDLTQIVKATAKTLKVKIDTTGATVLAARARKTPRVAINLVQRVRDYVVVKNVDKVDHNVAVKIMEFMEIDNQGLDATDRRYLTLLIEQYKGGPVGIENIASALGEELDTLTETVEPFLIQQGLLIRTSKGRTVTDGAYKALQKGLPEMR